MSDPSLSDIDFKNKMVWTTLKSPLFFSKNEFRIVPSILFDGTAFRWNQYLAQRPDFAPLDSEEVAEIFNYSTLIGKRLALKMLLYRPMWCLFMVIFMVSLVQKFINQRSCDICLVFLLPMKISRYNWPIKIHLECCHVFQFFVLLQSEPRLSFQTCHINIMNLNHTSQLILWNFITQSIIKPMSTISMLLMKPFKKQSTLEMWQNKFNSTTESNSMVVVTSTTPSSGRFVTFILKS